MARLRMLFIDDKEEDIAYAKKAMEKASFRCAFVTFPHVKDALEEFQPHMAIVDRIEGDPPEHKNMGRFVVDEIWHHRFCPIIIYTAFPDDERDEKEAHPLVRHATKGANFAPFQAAVNVLSPHANAIKTAEDHIHQQFSFAMRDVALYASTVCATQVEFDQAVIRHGRRRVAALMDQSTLGPLSSWEQYLHPPVSEDTKLGDIIRSKDGNPDDPAAFRLVLTPSCDMVAGQGARTDTILVARCVPNEAALKALGMETAKASTVKTHLLTAGYRDGMLPLPALKGRIPSMMADLKKLELLPRGDIGIEKAYERIASIDSPFRELIAWAYLTVACRPAVPVRDFDAWADEVAPAKPGGAKAK